jgi:hypothetical protein
MKEEIVLKLQVECVMFFHNNPYALESIEGLSLRLGREVELLEAILLRLVSLAILERIGNGPRSIYRYIPPITMDDKDLQWKSS